MQIRREGADEKGKIDEEGPDEEGTRPRRALPDRTGSRRGGTLLGVRTLVTGLPPRRSRLKREVLLVRADWRREVPEKYYFWRGKRFEPFFLERETV